MSFNATLAAAAAAATAPETGTEAGTGTQTAGQAAAQQAPPAGDLRSIPAEEHQRLLGLETKYLEVQRQQAAELDRKEAARIRALAEKGQVEDALNQQRASWESKHAEAVKRYESLQTEILGEKLTATIANAFAGREFVGETAEEKAAAQADLARLLEADFEAVRDSAGKIVIRERKTGREAAAALKERLDGRRYGLYFASKGAGANSRPAGGQPPAANLGGGDDFLTKNAAEFNGRQTAGFGFFAVPR